MGIKTYSAFTYGHTITDGNLTIDFDEGVGELTAKLNVGSYSLQDFAIEVSKAINAVGSQEYSISLDRSTRVISISAPSTFKLLPVSGTNTATSALPLVGFSTDTVLNLINIGDYPSGSLYTPQNILQRFVDFDDNVKTTNSTIRQTATGAVEVVSYGSVKFMECNITPITDITPQLSIISNANAVSEFRKFMNYCIGKAPIEFIPDTLTPNTFKKCLLESTRESKDGVNFKIKELFSKKLFGYYESGNLIFRGL